ncbi:MAG: 16S rRNA (cytosine(1402)-N(4))-methyltransferase RsmH [Actinomycetota bacterium]|nr:16S rRNA (cytosine(1402)-N(4))-methyltransferase RsmH [Actinomycetota bacterium]
MATAHNPVMLEETVETLTLEGAEMVVDTTFGGGGHTRRILRELGPEGRVLGIDRDPEVAARAAGLAEEDRRFTFRPGAYDEVLEGLVAEGVKVDAVLFDLGLSSYQIDEAARGFSYVREGPLDMRMNPERGESAADFLNGAEPPEIADVLVRYGDVPRGEARRVAREIVRRRPLATTLELSEAVRAAVGWKERGGNPAKRIFQAVRVYINDEANGLQRALSAAERLLSPGGRLVAITFHSGEDRVVKRFVSERAGRCVCPPELPVCICGARPTFRKGPVRRPSSREVEENPRSASARLRSAVRTSEPLDVAHSPEETP